MNPLRLAFGNWFSRAYLLGVLATAIFVAVSIATWRGPDANFAAVWIFFVTAPVSFLGTAAPATAVGAPLVILAIVLGALVNATVIGLLVALAGRLRLTRVEDN